MGTSKSSSGAGSGVSFDPPWLDAAEGGIDAGQADAPLGPPDSGNESEAGDDAAAPAGSQVGTPTSEVAPQGRYGDARRKLTSYIKSGNQGKLKAAVSSFVGKGLGGAKKASSRMRMSSKAASAIGGFLAAAREGTDPGIAAWVIGIKARGLSAKEAALETVKRLIPEGGSVDEESAKNSMAQAIGRLYEDDPNVDIFDLTDDQIATVMSDTIAFDVYNRAQLELGQVFEHLKYSSEVVQQRLSEALEYIISVVRSAMGKARSGGRALTAREISERALRNALEVFVET
jgi:hypothetical protein